MNKSNFRLYALYALGEMVLVVIGILIALQINNWNEDKKKLEFELYVLNVIGGNLEEDGQQMADILQNRNEALQAIEVLEKGKFSDHTEQDLGAEVANLLTFDRFYSINNGYEMMKSNGLIISDEELRTQLGRYYEYEVNIVNSSIQDIENYFMEKTEPMIQKGYFKNVEYGELISFTDYTDPRMEQDILQYIGNFKENHKGSVARIRAFKEKNDALNAAVDNAIRNLQ